MAAIRGLRSDTARAPDRTRAQAALSVAPWVLAAAALVMLSWPHEPNIPLPGLDASWGGALHMAAHSSIRFGSQLVFTYGPLGFLSRPQFWYADTAEAALIYKLLFRLALGIALFAAARRTYGRVGAALMALAVASAIGEPVPVLVFIVLVLALDRDRVGSRGVALALGLGVLAGVELLVKLSIGIEVALLLAAFVIWVPADRLRHLIAAGAGMTVALLVGWIATGQTLSDLPGYLHNGARIVSGFAAAMSYEDPALHWEYTAALFVFLVGVAGVLQSTATVAPRRRMALLTLWLVLMFMSFKEGFVRHDPHHGQFYFEAALGGFLALRWRPSRRWIGFALAAALFTVLIAGKNGAVDDTIDPPGDAQAAWNDLSPLFSAGQRRDAEAQGRLAIQAADPVDPETLALLNGHTVDVLPIETSVVWAYHLRWRPLPVFQSYSAYTSGLDALNARALASARAPDRILESPVGAIDARFLYFDQPATTRAILCRYVEMRVTPAWMVLGRGPNRCGPSVLIGSVRAAWGESVSVPPSPNADTVVFVKIAGVQVAGLERIRSALYKPVQRDILLNGAYYRLTPGTASNGLIVRAPPPVDFTPPYNVSPEASTINVLRTDGSGAGGRPLRYDFYEMSILQPPRVAVAPPSPTRPASGIGRGRGAAGPHGGRPRRRR